MTVYFDTFNLDSSQVKYHYFFMNNSLYLKEKKCSKRVFTGFKRY